MSGFFKDSDKSFIFKVFSPIVCMDNLVLNGATNWWPISGALIIIPAVHNVLNAVSLIPSKILTSFLPNMYLSETFPTILSSISLGTSSPMSIPHLFMLEPIFLRPSRQPTLKSALYLNEFFNLPSIPCVTYSVATAEAPVKVAAPYI